MLKNDTLKNGTSRIGLYGSAPRDFCRVREEQLRLYLIFTSIKVHMYGKQSTLSHKEAISTCCHHSMVKIFLNF